MTNPISGNSWKGCCEAPAVLVFHRSYLQPTEQIKRSFVSNVVRHLPQPSHPQLMGHLICLRPTPWPLNPVIMLQGCTAPQGQRWSAASASGSAAGWAPMQASASTSSSATWTPAPTCGTRCAWQLRSTLSMLASAGLGQGARLGHALWHSCTSVVLDPPTLGWGVAHRQLHVRADVTTFHHQACVKQEEATYTPGPYLQLPDPPL